MSAFALISLLDAVASPFGHAFLPPLITAGIRIPIADLAPLLVPLEPFLPVAVPVVLVAAGGVWLYGKLSSQDSPGVSPPPPRPVSTPPSRPPSGAPGAHPSASAAAASGAPATALREKPIDPASAPRLPVGPEREPQDADVTVFAPGKVAPRQDILVQVIIHTPDREEEAAARALVNEPGVRRAASVPLQLQLHPGDAIKATLDAGAAKVASPVQTTAWNGRLVCLFFKMRLPDAADTILQPELRVFVNGLPAGNVVFQIDMKSGAADAPLLPVPQQGYAYRRRFISYASEDRVKVLEAVQVMKANRLNYFQDTLSLEPGDRWQKKLFLEIDKCDLFLLFWSKYARQSQWVVREAEYALRASRSRKLEIVPVVLELPPPHPPPELDEIHFNDPVRAVIEWEKEAPRPGPRLPPKASGPLVLKIGPVTCLLNPGAHVLPQMLGAAGAGRGKDPIGEVVVNPHDPNAVGLLNRSSESWAAELPTGETREIAAGRAIRLAPGVVIDFRGIKGIVQDA